jgi:hypothetical protein
MGEITMVKVHVCGAVVYDERRCPRCHKPLMHIPDEIFALSKNVERITGLDRARVSLLGIVTSTYMAGWDDAMAAIAEQAASEGDADA